MVWYSWIASRLGIPAITAAEGGRRGVPNLQRTLSQMPFQKDVSGDLPPDEDWVHRELSGRRRVPRSLPGPDVGKLLVGRHPARRDAAGLQSIQRASPLRVCVNGLPQTRGDHRSQDELTKQEPGHGLTRFLLRLVRPMRTGRCPLRSQRPRVSLSVGGARNTEASLLRAQRKRGTGVPPPPMRTGYTQLRRESLASLRERTSANS